MNDEGSGSDHASARAPAKLHLRRASDSIDPAVLSELCSHCGSCCDGTLFTHVALTEHDVARLAEHGGAATFENKNVLWLGCQHHSHSQGGCGIYSDRPDLCRSFRCRTLADLADGAIPLSVALERVRSLRAVVAELIERHGPPPAGKMLETWVVSRLSDVNEVEQAKAAFGLLRYLEKMYFSRAPDA
jgi:uncharacterized protein